MLLSALSLVAAAAAAAAAADANPVSLWPCHSVHRLLPGTTVLYRSVGSPGCDCVYTMEGPADSQLTLRLHDVVVDGGHTNAVAHGDYGDCAHGVVRVFNMAITGALLMADTACSSVQESKTVRTDTNIAVVTSTFQRGHFLLTVIVNPDNGAIDLVPPSVISSGNNNNNVSVSIEGTSQPPTISTNNAEATMTSNAALREQTTAAVQTESEEQPDINEEEVTQDPDITKSGG